MPLAKSRFIDKPWGHEEVFAENDRYVGKILFVKKGEALSLQYHEKKEETLRVMDGKLELFLGEHQDSLDRFELESGQVFHVQPGELHRMVGLTDCLLLEVSTTELDDVVRLEDRYGRAGTNAP